MRVLTAIVYLGTGLPRWLRYRDAVNEREVVEATRGLRSLLQTAKPSQNVQSVGRVSAGDHHVL